MACQSFENPKIKRYGLSALTCPFMQSINFIKRLVQEPGDYFLDLESSPCTKAKVYFNIFTRKSAESVHQIFIINYRITPANF